MRGLLFLGGGILIGVGVSWAEATRQAELRANDRIDEEVATYRHILDMAYEGLTPIESPVPHEALLEEMSPERIFGTESAEAEKTNIRETPLSSVTPSADYVNHVQEYWDPSATTVETRFEYITEEEFEESTAIKEEILIHMGGDAMPLFIQDGVMLVDWDEMIPNTILADMYSQCPPGEDKVLFVRNQKNGIDYRVRQEIP